MCLCNTDAQVAINPKMDILRIESQWRSQGYRPLECFFYLQSMHYTSRIISYCSKVLKMVEKKNNEIKWYSLECGYGLFKTHSNLTVSLLTLAKIAPKICVVFSVMDPDARSTAKIGWVCIPILRNEAMGVPDGDGLRDIKKNGCKWCILR